MHAHEIKGVKEGKQRVRRKTWSAGDFIRFNPVLLIWTDENDNFFPAGLGRNYEFLNNDWEPYTEKKVTSNALEILTKRFGKDPEFQAELKKERKILKRQMSKKKGKKC